MNGMVHYSETFPDLIQGVLTDIESDTEGALEIGENERFYGIPFPYIN